MDAIDYIYRFDPRNSSAKPHPASAEAARKVLEDGNRMFARWMTSCQTNTPTAEDELRYVVQCNELEVGMVRKADGMPKQSPFAVVVGCSDARVPAEMLFGQGCNNVFVIRVAGNVLGDVCLGSIDFAVTALSESVRCLVVLGHRGCGAVAGTVESYLAPSKFWSKSTSPALRTIFQKIFVAVREADNGLREVWGADAPNLPGYREALMDVAVLLNAAHTAFDVHQSIERAGKPEIEVLYAVYHPNTARIWTPTDPTGSPAADNIRLACAPTDPRELTRLAIQMAEMMKPGGTNGSLFPPR